MEEELQYLFEMDHLRVSPKKGDILIAEPFMIEEVFERSVVYVAEITKTSSVGFMLNKPLPFTTSDLLTELRGIYFPVYMGGPVEQEQVYFFHTRPEIPHSIHVKDGIFWGGDFDFVTQLIKLDMLDQSEIRFFSGYSGWDDNKLTQEMSDNSWLVGGIRVRDFFRLPNEYLWEQSMYDLGGKYKIWSKFPKDPILN